MPQLRWSTVCGEDFNSSSGVFRSPNYPGTYPDYLHCQYRILAGPDDYVNLRFTGQFKIESE